MVKLNLQNIRAMVLLALKEDQGHGDATSEYILDSLVWGQGDFLAKSDLVLAGWPLVTAVFQMLSPQVSSKSHFKEGELVSKGSIIGSIFGPANLLLTGERVALNFLQRLCGIATQTRQFVQAVQGTKTSILDTRKTTPGLRLIEKYAVRVGGAYNHRWGLYDGILIKDNHIRAAGSIQEAVQRVRTRIGHLQKIELEVSSLQELKDALKTSVEVILLDNMTPNEVRSCVAEVNGRAILEVSGNIDLGNIADYADCGVEFISVGTLTHSVKAADISLVFRLDKPL